MRRTLFHAGIAQLAITMPVLAQGGWVASASTNKMDDTPIVTVSLAATEDIPAWVAKVRPRLILRCLEDQTELIVYAGMAAHPELGRYAQATVRLRFDNARPISAVWNESTSGGALFAPDPMAILAQLRPARKSL